VSIRRLTLAGASALCLMVVTLAGCGGEDPNAPKPAITGNVSGKVAYKGAGVTEGQVVFTNLKLRTDVVGELGAEGAYKATNLPEGDYSVRVTPLPVKPSMDPKVPTPKPADPANIPKKYRAAQSSGLKTAIKKGENTFDITLE
jgi:hypothetical protein